MAEATISSVQIKAGLNSYDMAHPPSSRWRMPTLYSESIFIGYSCTVCMYVSMYVRVSLYFIDIKLDIALIHHLPDLEKRTRLRPALDRVDQEKEKKKIYGVSKTIISNIVTTETAFHCPQKLELNYTDYRMDSRRQKRWKCK